MENVWNEVSEQWAGGKFCSIQKFMESSLQLGIPGTNSKFNLGIIAQQKHKKNMLSNKSNFSHQNLNIAVFLEYELSQTMMESV